MGNKALGRRLAAIEAGFDEAAERLERECRLADKRSISTEEAERTYRLLMASAHRTACSHNLSLNDLMARYFRMVREPVFPQRRRG